MNNDSITTGQFIEMVIKTCIKGTESICGYIDYAFGRGIINDYDILNREKPVERRSAARIIHEALLKEYKESDEEKWLGAERFSDLYDCHSCVNHIAQVYSKGIMAGRTDTFFDNYGFLTYDEAKTVTERMAERDKRITVEEKVSAVKELMPEEAFAIMSADSSAVLIDVRPCEAYEEGHIKNSRNITAENIRKNPYIVSADKNTQIILYCIKGYKSRLSAEILKKAGYCSVYIIPGVEQYEYELVK